MKSLTTKILYVSLLLLLAPALIIPLAQAETPIHPPVDDPELYYAAMSFINRAGGSQGASGTQEWVALSKAVQRQVGIDDADYETLRTESARLLDKLSSSAQPPTLNVRNVTILDTRNRLSQLLSPAGYRSFTHFVNSFIRDGLWAVHSR